MLRQMFAEHYHYRVSFLRIAKLYQPLVINARFEQCWLNAITTASL
jgi:hypothetical protein